MKYKPSVVLSLGLAAMLWVAGSAVAGQNDNQNTQNSNQTTQNSNPNPKGEGIPNPFHRGHKKSSSKPKSDKKKGNANTGNTNSGNANSGTQNSNNMNR